MQDEAPSEPPTELKAQPEERRLTELDLLRARVIRVSSYLVLAVAPIAELPRFVAQGPTGSTIAALTMMIGAVISLLFLHRERCSLAAACLLPPLGASLLWRAVADGDEVGFFWFGSFIMVAALLAGSRVGWAAAGLGMLAAPLLHGDDVTWTLLLECAAVFLVTAGIFSGLEAAFVRAMKLRQSAEDILRQTNERYAYAAEGAGYGAWEWDSEVDHFWFAPGVQSIRGLPAEEQWLNRDSFRRTVHPEDVDRAFTAFQEHLGGGRAQLHVLFRLHHADGRWIWVEGQGAARRDDDGRNVRLFGSLRDVTARKLMEQALHRQAFYDELTGLPNRSLFLDRLQQSIRRARRLGEANYAVLFLDLDRFKIVNDSLGHDVGDMLLAEFGRRLASSVRGVDTAARLGGDEFAVLLEGVGPGEVQLAVDRIQEQLEEPFLLAGRELFVGASVGVLEGSLTYEDPREALRDADLAMYSAKGASHSVGRFKPTLRLEAEHRLELDQAIIRGLERDEFEPWFQPMFDLRTGELKGFEALCRWRRSDGKLVWPGEFVPRAEETGAIAKIDRKVMEKACFAAAAWNHDRRRPVELSVNISAWLFRDEGLPATIERILKRSGLDPTYLHLELTESVFLADVPGLDERLERLRNMGLRLAVDDFGTGYSSMSYLHRFRVHRLKVDRAFVQENGEAGPGPLCRAILGMAEALGVDVVAEGIETEEQQAELLRLGCTQGQGWLLGRALPGAAAAELSRQDQIDALRTQALPSVDRDADLAETAKTLPVVPVLRRTAG